MEGVLDSHTCATLSIHLIFVAQDEMPNFIPVHTINDVYGILLIAKYVRLLKEYRGGRREYT